MSWLRREIEEWIGARFMGMDYVYSGSASYPRFEKELYAVAKVFGGIKTEHLKTLEATASERPFGYWFGAYSADGSDVSKFVFPSGTDKTLVKWFNNIYGDFTTDETLAIWKSVSKHPEIEEISFQIWNELKETVKVEESWKIL